MTLEIQNKSMNQWKSFTCLCHNPVIINKSLHGSILGIILRTGP